MNALLVVLAVQTPVWTVTPRAATVGDSVVLMRHAAVDPEVRWRLIPLAPSAAIEPLGEPVGQYAELRLTVVYRVAPFATGNVAVPMPDLELVRPDGTVETLAGDTAWIHVVSVLPAEDSLVEPRGALGLIERPRTTPVPLLALTALVLAGIGAWGTARLRAGARPPHDGSSAAPDDPPLADWIAAGELRAVAAVTADKLRTHIANVVPQAGRHLAAQECLAVLDRERPDWPLRDLQSVIASLDRTRFAPAVGEDVRTLVDDTRALLEQLVERPAEESE